MQHNSSLSKVQCHKCTTAYTTSHVCASVSVPSVQHCMLAVHTHKSCLLCTLTCQNTKQRLVHMLLYNITLMHSLAACPCAAHAMPFTFLDSFVEDMSSLGVSSIHANCTLQWLKYLAFVSYMRGSILAGSCTTFHVSPNSRLLGLAHLCCCTNDPPESSRTNMATDYRQIGLTDHYHCYFRTMQKR